MDIPPSDGNVNSNPADTKQTKIRENEMKCSSKCFENSNAVTYPPPPSAPTFIPSVHARPSQGGLDRIILKYLPTTTATTMTNAPNGTNSLEY